MNVTTPIPVKTFQESPIVENHIDINEIEEEITKSLTQEDIDFLEKISASVEAEKEPTPEPEEEPTGILKTFKDLKPAINAGQGSMVAHNLLAHSVAVVTYGAKILAARSGKENFLSKNHEVITGYAGIMGRLDGLPSTLRACLES